jgi:hypothetical protein
LAHAATPVFPGPGPARGPGACVRAIPAVRPPGEPFGRGGDGSGSDQNGSVPMRSDCRHYETRTYGSGEVVHRCKLNLAPEAPWRCPDECPSYSQRRMDVGWHYGSLGAASRKSEAEPTGDDVSALLDATEDIVNNAAPDILADFDGKKKRRRRRKRR